VKQRLKQKNIALGIFLILLIIISAITACSVTRQEEGKTQEGKPVTKTNFLMGTLAKVTIYDQIDDKTVFTRIFDRIREIEDRMTINKDTDKSEIIKLNNAAGNDYVELSPDTFFVLQKGKYYGGISQGKFDITIGPIVKLWNIDTEKAAVPSQDLISEKLPLIDYHRLELEEGTRKAKLATEGMMVDLGAIAKGYAADEAARILIEAGIKHAIVNLGGNILTVGNKPDGTLFRIGLQDPYRPRNENMAVVQLQNQSLVSSGTYEKFFEADGKRYHHIIDPKTGYPAENGLVSVSIITTNSIDADALSTSIFLLGLEEGMNLVEELEDVEAIFVTNDKKVYLSSGIDRDNFTLINEDYQLQDER
jgi:thiamine biosynthesis lipoprotein